MPIFHAIVLGLVQGLSEFLPISSSGHLLLVPWLFGWNDLDDVSVKKAFDVSLHLGTLIAVTAYYGRDVVSYVRDGVRSIVRRDRPTTEPGRMARLLVVASIPAAVVGVVLETWIDERLGKPWIIAVSLIGFGLVLAWADRRRGERAFEQVGLRDAAIIGVAQVLALNPGTSRSGICMSAARARGFSRDAAARFSFLLSIPVTAGAVVVKVGGLVTDGLPDGLLWPMIAGVMTAGLSGWWAVWALMRLIRTKSFDGFVAYRVLAGVGVMLVLASGWR
ncbi:MAG: undecaprenyl-diphosphate phosphatase [Actinobacteria bacterium]|nr:undecaprenyl-diphosphate phosphatase [Actinomycetota bacterium]